AVRGQAVWFEDVWSRGGKPRRQAIGTLSCGWRHEMAQPARTALPAQGGVAVPVEVPMPEVPAVRRAEVAVQAHGTGTLVFQGQNHPLQAVGEAASVGFENGFLGRPQAHEGGGAMRGG